MNNDLSSFAARLRAQISSQPPANISDPEFNALALELFSLQFAHNAAYRKICEARKLTPRVVKHWTQIPFVPTSAFKELELTSLAPGDRAIVFHSSGTTVQTPSRHFHHADSLELYEASLWSWFRQNMFENSKLVSLTPPPKRAPHSSLVHMFETIRKELNAPETAFTGKLDANGHWTLDFDAVRATLAHEPGHVLVVGTAFSFVHLLDFLAEKNLQLQLPKGSHVMETGGYKNRSRSLPKAELHALITKYLGVTAENIVCEYGMSELSSQAYDSLQAPRLFRFPSWTRAQIISPESGREVTDGEQGLIRIFDLANVFSVAAIQTEDLGIRHGDGFELVGRAKLSEPRGCSLMAA